MVYILHHKLALAPVGLYQHYKEQGRIELQTKQEGKLMSHLVHCYHARTGRWVASKYSDDDGNVTFDNLIVGVKYFVVMVDRVSDDTHYAPDCQDWVVAQ